MRSLLFTVFCTVILAIGGTAYFALKSGLPPSGPKVVLKIEPLDSAMGAGALAQAAEPDSASQSAGPKEEAPSEPAAVAGVEQAPPADPFRAAFNEPGSGKAIGDDTLPPSEAESREPAPSAGTPEPTAIQSAPVAPTDFRKSSLEEETVASVAPQEETAPRLAPVESVRSTPSAEAAGGDGLRVPEKQAPLQEQASLQDRTPEQETTDALPFKEGADMDQSASAGEGVTMDGVEFVEAPQEVLEQVMIQAADSTSEPMVANTAGQGINHSGRPAKKDLRPEPKKPPMMLHFSAANLASASKNAPAADKVPVGGTDPASE
jgi:hypothetical protein